MSECPNVRMSECGDAMKIISSIEPRQTESLSNPPTLWAVARFHSRPCIAASTSGGKKSLPTALSEYELVPDGESFEVQSGETQAEQSRELQLVLDPEFL